MKNNKILETIDIDYNNDKSYEHTQCFYNENNSSIQTIIITIVITICTSVPLDIILSKLIDLLRAKTNYNFNYNFNYNSNKIIPIETKLFDIENKNKNNSQSYKYIVKSYNISQELKNTKNSLNKLFNKNYFNIENGFVSKNTICNNNNYIYDIEIFQTLISTLIGQKTSSDKLFLKFVSESFYKESNVDWKIKLLSVIILLSMNIGSLIYIALKGAMRGSEWQQIYLNACIINWFSEIFFVQIIEILWIYFMVAGLIRNRLMNVIKFIKSIGILLYEEKNYMYKLKSKYQEWLNTIQMYFPIFLELEPNTFESKLIEKISSLKNSNEKKSNKKYIISSEDNILTIILSSIPFELQRILSSLFSSILIVILLFGWYNYKSVILMLLGIFLICVLITIGYLKYEANKINKINFYNYFEYKNILLKFFDIDEKLNEFYIDEKLNEFYIDEKLNEFDIQNYIEFNFNDIISLKSMDSLVSSSSSSISPISSIFNISDITDITDIYDITDITDVTDITDIYDNSTSSINSNNFDTYLEQKFSGIFIDYD
jgi:hypothetical protein